MLRASVEEIDPASFRKPFASFAKFVSGMAGHPVAFMLAVIIVLVWLASGEYFEYSDRWQLYINTGTTISTFLIVFLIQNTQNRDSVSLQLKLDELIRADDDAHKALLDLEELTDKELILLKRRYEELARKAREKLRKGKKDTGIQEVL